MTPLKLPKPFYPYTEADAKKAWEDWGCNCGPTALATMTSLTLDEVHPHIPKFDEREYTNPTMMKAALVAIGVPWTERVPLPSETMGHFRDGYHPPTDSFDPHVLTRYGLCRIQWEGPWYGRFAYHKTHWVGAMEWNKEVWVFDCNGGWMPQARWEKEVVPTLTALYKRATGAWHATHRWELWP